MAKFTRKEIWRHNGLLGQVAFAKAGMDQIKKSKTATPAAKTIATKIKADLLVLRELLRTRIDTQ